MDIASADQPATQQNPLGMAAFILGLIALVFAFIPFIGTVAWLLAPLAIVFGLIALRRTPRSLAIAGIVIGGIALLVCFSWIRAVQFFGEALNKDSFNRTGQTVDNSQAPLMNASIRDIWRELDENKIAAGAKYDGHRLAFTDEEIRDFSGSADAPVIQFEGGGDQYLRYLVAASFQPSDSQRIGGLRKRAKISFMCEEIRETIGPGYSLSRCSLK